ncbi:SURF1 family protein [Allosalinactinospora lopnorensis]|uniref:SURF1 family protein n=1 Tax=Allosalinactinospora lopnorensis TaxID=1352348 RepID=UPI0009E5741E|nr:SURF1 family protein [Allosalinactinospora lopnorensis]
MRYPLLQPRWLGLHALVVLAVVTCFAFGYWQFMRAQEPSRDVITSPVENPDSASELSTVLAPGEYMPHDRANTAVTAAGEYDTGAEMLVPARSPQGGEGYNVIAPLVTEDGSAVIVHLGWVDGDADSPQDLAPLPEGEVTVTGWLLPPQKEDEGVIPISMPEGQVERIAPSLLMNVWEYRLYEGYVLLASQEPSGAPAERQGVRPQEVSPPDPPREIEWNWRSVSYAAQWVVFGAAAFVFWIVLMRRELAGQVHGSSGAADPDGGAGGDGSGGTPEDPGGGESAGSAGSQPSATGTSSP